MQQGDDNNTKWAGFAQFGQPIVLASGGGDTGGVELKVQDWTHGRRGHPPQDVGVILVGSSGYSIQSLRAGGGFATASTARYAKLAFSVFSWFPIIFLLVLSSPFSYFTSTGTGADDDLVDLGIVKWRGQYHHGSTPTSLGQVVEGQRRD